jgi:hypothetical protein
LFSAQKALTWLRIRYFEAIGGKVTNYDFLQLIPIIMNSLELKKSGKIETYIVAVLLFSVVLASTFGKEFFVEETGNFKIFGNFGILLVIGLLLKWKYIRSVVSVLTGVSIIAILMMIIMVKSITLPFFLLLTILVISFYLSTFSKRLKAYVEE